MAKRPSAPRRGAEPLSAEEMRVLEDLVARGVLVAVPPAKNALPRRVTAAALADGGSRVLLYLGDKADGGR